MNKDEYIRRTGIEKIRSKELIMRLVEQQKMITRKDVINLLHVTRLKLTEFLRN